MVFEEILGYLLKRLYSAMKRFNRETIILMTIISLMFVFFSCTTMRTLEIEIPQPSSKELPPDIQSITLVNRTVDNQYTDLPADSLQKIFYKGQFNIDTTVYDLQSVDTTLQANLSYALARS
jgi:hypothetical protein